MDTFLMFGLSWILRWLSYMAYHPKQSGVLTTRCLGRKLGM